MTIPAHVSVNNLANRLLCTRCDTECPIPTRIRNNPELRLEFIELWAQRHADCSALKLKYLM